MNHLIFLNQITVWSELGYALFIVLYGGTCLRILRLVLLGGDVIASFVVPLATSVNSPYIVFARCLNAIFIRLISPLLDFFKT